MNEKWVSLICLILAFLNKVAIAGLYTDLEDDKSLYLLLADSASKGKSFLEPVNFWGNTHTSYVFDPAAYSPLYSILSAPVLWVTNSFTATSFIIDVLAWSVFITGLYKLASSIFRERWMTNVYVLCSGFFLYPHEIFSSPKDTLAIGLLLWGCYLIYKLVFCKSSVMLSVFASLAFVLLALTKFLYAPLCLLFIFILFLGALLNKDRKLLSHAIVSLSVLLISIIIYTLFIASLKSHAVPLKVNPDGTAFLRGFFPENLFSAFPFIISSVINTNFLGVQLERLFNIPFLTFTRMFQIVDLLIIVFVLIFFILHSNKLNRLPKQFWILLVFSAAIVTMVFLMSLTYRAVVYRVSGHSYTYVQEARSFLLAMLTIQFLAFYIIFRTKVMFIFKVLSLFLFIVEGAHGIYFTGKQILNWEAVTAQVLVRSSGKQLVNQLLENRDEKLELITTENTLRRLALVHGITAFSIPSVCDRQIRSSAPTVVAVLESDTTAIKTCLNQQSAFTRVSFAPYLLEFHDIKKP